MQFECGAHILTSYMLPALLPWHEPLSGQGTYMTTRSCPGTTWAPKLYHRFFYQQVKHLLVHFTSQVSAFEEDIHQNGVRL